MTHDTDTIRHLLETAQIEIYRSHAEGFEIAERVRVHMMDSGVRVRVDGALRVRFSARAQRSDAPAASAEELFEKVASQTGQEADRRGYEEAERRVVEVKDPMNKEKTLDVWHELVFEKTVGQAELIDEIRWALSVEKFVG